MKMNTVFYMQRNGGMYYDIKLQANNWNDAIAEAKRTANYALTRLPAKKRNKMGIDDYIEVYCGKLRKDMNFSDLSNSEIYQKIY